MFSFGDLTGVLREAGIPLRESLYDGNNPHFLAVLARPDLFLWEEWALAIFGRPGRDRALEAWKGDVRYECVKIVQVKGAPPMEIYRRVRSIPAR